MADMDRPVLPSAAPSRVPSRVRPRRRAATPDDRVLGLDGLRALAVVAVLAYHVVPDAVPGGFLGVDVFFVVSGFLITTLLVRELRRTRRIRLGAFWIRRARRLLPALAVVVVVCVAAARLVAPDLLVGVGRQVLGAATFSSNWLEIAAEKSYFDATSPVLFQTFWSLAVEEQFYLLWPVVLVLLLAGVSRPRWRSRALLAAALTSAVAMAVLYDAAGDPTRVYYGTGTHAFGLLLGAAVALRAAEGGRLLGARAARALVAPAFVGLVALVLVLPDDSPWTYRGGIALASVLTAVLVARCADAGLDARRSLGVRLLESPPAVWVGRRSYSLYLWHWPVLLLVAAVVPAAPGSVVWWRATVAAVVLSMVLSAVTYRWVEVPLRRDGLRGTLVRWRSALGPLAPRPVLGRVAVAGAGVTVLVAGIAVATAPQVTQAQLAVEQGQAAIAVAAQDGARDGADGVTVVDVAGTTPEDSVEQAAPGAVSGPGPEKDGARQDADGADETVASPRVRGGTISAFGDSVLSGAAPAVLDAFPGIHIDAEPIRKWVDAPELVRRAERRGELRDVVVLQFGTNGGFEFAGSREALAETLDVIGPDRTVVLVTSAGVSHWVPEANAELARVAAERDHVVVARWAQAVRERPGLLHSDRTHPNMEGIAVYAKVLQRAIASGA